MARQLSGGKVRLLAVASLARLKNFPDLPTFAEAGFPSLNLPGWGGIFLPAGTSPEIVARLNAEIVKAVRMADVAEKINGMGFVPVGNSTDAFATSIKSEFEKWEVAIRENQIRLD